MGHVCVCRHAVAWRPLVMWFILTVGMTELHAKHGQTLLIVQGWPNNRERKKLLGIWLVQVSQPVKGLLGCCDLGIVLSSFAMAVSMKDFGFVVGSSTRVETE